MSGLKQPQDMFTSTGILHVGTKTLVASRLVLLTEGNSRQVTIGLSLCQLG